MYRGNKDKIYVILRNRKTSHQGAWVEIPGKRDIREENAF